MTIVSLILLAAGASRRMGTPKQLLPYQGVSLLRHAANVAVETICDPVIVVIGSNAQQMHSELDNLPLQVVENPCWVEGIGSSIKAGLTEALTLQPDLDAVLVMLADQPLLTGAILNQFIARYQKTHPMIVTAAYAETMGVPALFDKSLFKNLLNLPPPVGAKHLIRKLATQAETVPLPKAAIDIDTPLDYAQLQT